MSRRSLTLLLASLLALGLTAGAAQARVPYVALGPGPTFNTLSEVDGAPVLEVSGRPTYATDGHLDLTTVSVQSDLTLVRALQGWFDRDLAVVPREVVYPPDKSDAQVAKENAAAMTQSQDAAVTAAARQLGFRTAEVLVKEVPAGSPSSARLRAGDVVTALNGTSVRDAADLRQLVAQHAVGDEVSVSYVREGFPRTATVSLGVSGGDAERRPILGIQTEEKPVKAPFSVKINLKDVGGPSAGLMFTLGILDKLGEPSLTGGRYIAGTGEISTDGSVGPIGGIAEKLIAAKAKGAVAFLVPEANCKEAARRPPRGLPLLEVGSVSDALDGLQALRRGQKPRLCPAA